MAPHLASKRLYRRWGLYPIIRDEELRQFVGESILLPRNPLRGQSDPVNQAEQLEDVSRRHVNCYSKLLPRLIDDTKNILGIYLHNHELAYAYDVHQGLNASEKSQELPKGGGLSTLLPSEILSRCYMRPTQGVSAP
jgi:hypothetical protein